MKYTLKALSCLAMAMVGLYQPVAEAMVKGADVSWLTQMEKAGNLSTTTAAPNRISFPSSRPMA